MSNCPDATFDVWGDTMSEYTTPAPLGPLVRELTEGETTPTDHLNVVRKRVEAVEPAVQTLVSEQDRWGRAARAADTLETRSGGDGESPTGRDLKSPLHGVPVGVKDIFHADGFDTRAGADVPPEVLTEAEGTAVRRLRDAGAIVLGKTVTTEFAYFAPGPTHNPHDLDHTPGGSSSGSAAAVAAGLCPLALGSQTIGSVARPAAFCGVVGVKPSYGRIPLDGVLPVAPSVDHVGFFTQQVAGAQLAASVLLPDWRPIEVPELGRVGVVDGGYLDQASSEGREAFRDHTRELDAAGIQTVSVEPFADISAVNDRHNSLVAAETALSHDTLFSVYGDQYAEETTELIQAGHEVTVKELVDARGGCRDLRERLHETMDELNLDVIVSPSAPGPAPMGLENTGDPIMNLPWTHAGVPTVTIPASLSADGLPLGLQCASRHGQDEQLLAWARTLAEAVYPGP
ncbi:MAG: aspartyl/glutamyl-tRNA amidotransferase subunit A [uncultured archaeon A07HR60]|nr:MAG: aspartyl/glutamyl-tRNA amidotransferase subunit A [uncultured archaeon A07HR60]